MRGKHRFLKEKLARPERFELPTPWFVARYSIQLSYGRAAGNLWRDLRVSWGPGQCPVAAKAQRLAPGRRGGGILPQRVLFTTPS